MERLGRAAAVRRGSDPLAGWSFSMAAPDRNCSAAYAPDQIFFAAGPGLAGRPKLLRGRARPEVRRHPGWLLRDRPEFPRRRPELCHHRRWGDGSAAVEKKREEGGEEGDDR
ncbi:unnamed protein product [Urochloa humidicola]